MNKKYRHALVAGNWKMNMTVSDAKPFLDALRNELPQKRGCDIVLCVPFPLLHAMQRPAKECRIGLGAQNVSEHEKGAYTGEVSLAMLADLGVKYVIVGHSERRQYYCETDSLVNAKAKALLAAGIAPIICVGETLEQRECGLTMEHIAYQVKAALFGLTSAEVKRCIIAYELIWAIGTGRNASAGQANDVCGFIRSVIRKNFGAYAARGAAILYGGSMNALNAAELLAESDIDGGLIGGASLKPADFAKIIAAASE